MKYFLCAASLPLLVGCTTGALDDTNFNLWCGASLCDWKTEQGKIRRVSTWDAQEYGVELVGNSVVLSQLVDLMAVTGPCVKFSILGNVDAHAEVQLNLDFFDDGTVDFREGIPELRWQRVDLVLKLPTQPYSSMKVSLDKQGNATAIFAALGVSNVSSCDGDPIALSNLLPGDWCTSDADCASGHCDGQPGRTNSAPTTCAECSSDADCSDGKLCGVERSQDADALFDGCIEPNSTADGDVCLSDQQCAHGHCQSGVCSECLTSAECDAGLECVPVASDGNAAHGACVMPGNLPTGATCGSDGDCANKHCLAGVCSECAIDADCTGGKICSAGACIRPGTLPLGSSCSDPRLCKSGICCGTCRAPTEDLCLFSD